MGMDFAEAIVSHTRWKRRLAALVEGAVDDELDAETVGRRDRCPLGRWLHHPANADDVALADARREHDDFHRLAAEVVRCVRQGDPARARELLSLDYAERSIAIVVLLKTRRGFVAATRVPSDGSEEL